MTQETFTPGDLLLDGEAKTQPAVIASGADVVRGAVLGRVTTGGKLKLSVAAASDGSEVPVGIAAEAIEASGADGLGPVWFMGSFDGAQLTFGAGHTAATVEAAFRAASAPLFIKTPV